MKTKVVNLKYEKYDIYIGRGSKWGNPYRIDIDGTREEVIARYRYYLNNNKSLLEDLNELKDKILGCFCKPLDCHGDVLIEVLEKRGIICVEKQLRS